MQHDFHIGILPVEAVLLVADVLDGLARHGSILSLVTDDGPRTSPAITTLLVVTRVSQATRTALGSIPSVRASRKNRSTTSSEIGR